VILICHPSFATASRSSDLIPFMQLARDYLSGEEQMVHEGNLSALQSKRGTYGEDLKEQRELQQRFESSPEGADRSRNILAAKTHQTDLLIRTGQADEALNELPSMLDEIKDLNGGPAFTEAQVLGLFAEAYRAKEQYGTSAKYFSHALGSLEARGQRKIDPFCIRFPVLLQ